MTNPRNPILVDTVGNLRVEVYEQERATWYTFSGPQHGRITVLGHELGRLAKLAERWAEKAAAARALELAKMKRPAAKPLPFGRRKVVRA